MRKVVSFAAALVIGLGLLTWVASRIVERTARQWFDKDIQMRARLVVGGARQSLVSHWSPAQRIELRDVLSDITRDERIMAAAACTTDLRMLTRTKDFPDLFTCASIGARMRQAGSRGEEWLPATTVESLPGGNVDVNAVPLEEGGKPLGFVVLVHDLSFVEHREAKTRQFIFVAFAFLAIAASCVTLVAARLSWRGWSAELRGLLQGGGRTRRAEFRPLLGDVRELVDRIVAERDLDREGGDWTPQRLAHTLNRYLHGEKVVILANREPYIHERLADGKIAVLHPASGLVTALEPVMRACSGTWIGHGSGSADAESADRGGRVGVPPGEESYTLRRVFLTRDEEKGYYYGFSNEGLWPLCHVSDQRPSFRTQDWGAYQRVNAKFVQALTEEVDSDDPIVFVQDYHFALAPQLIRVRLPRATVIMFWHIPWPNAQRFEICPWSKDLLRGMLGANILGFHTQFDCNNFLDSVDRLMEARIDREQNAVVFQGHRTLVRPYPIALEWPVRWLADLPPAAECRASIFEELGLRSDALLGVGVDRLDYTKGVEERFLSVERLLERFPEYRGRFTFVQLAAPSRVAIERYRLLNERVEDLASRINRRFGENGYRPIILKRSHHEPPTVFRYYRAADVCYVSSLHDGMNLVAKEFVASRDDDDGVLVLSQFTGAARELTEALIVNPYDVDEASAALHAALRMSPEEKRDRMRSMRSLLSEFNVYRWAGRMLVDASRLRSRERLTGRLADHLAAAEAS